MIKLKIIVKEIFTPRPLQFCFEFRRCDDQFKNDCQGNFHTQVFATFVFNFGDVMINSRIIVKETITPRPLKFRFDFLRGDDQTKNNS